MDRGAWQAAVHRAAKSRTQLKQLTMHAYPFPLLCSLANKLLKICDTLQREGKRQGSVYPCGVLIIG